MKNVYILLLGLVLLLGSCASNRYSLGRTVWYSLSPAEKDGVQGTVVTSLFFVSDSTVNVFSSVVVDSTLVVTPFMIGRGTFSVSGNPRREADISMTIENLNKEVVEYSGRFHRDRAMILVSQDSIVSLYGILRNTRLP